MPMESISELVGLIEDERDHALERIAEALRQNRPERAFYAARTYISCIRMTRVWVGREVRNRRPHEAVEIAKAANQTISRLIEALGPHDRGDQIVTRGQSAVVDIYKPLYNAGVAIEGINCRKGSCPDGYLPIEMRVVGKCVAHSDDPNDPGYNVITFADGQTFRLVDEGGRNQAESLDPTHLPFDLYQRDLEKVPEPWHLIGRCGITWKGELMSAIATAVAVTSAN